MKVTIGKRTFHCSHPEYLNILEQAEKMVKRGIFAIEQKGEAIILTEELTTTQLKMRTQMYKRKGWKVYANR